MEKIHFADREAWRSWLENHHRAQKGIWLVFYKKHTGRPTLNYDDAVEEAICFGWIDGLIKRLDEERCARIFTPRAARSTWSALNIRRAKKMIREGRMIPVGLKTFRQFRGRHSCVSRADPNPPPELLGSLRANATAFAYFCTLAPSHRRRYVGWILDAKRPETRVRRLEEALALLEKGQKLGLK
jgi:uncharacterized protein YdeI (YjbR/CyaY-like superfamily)